MSARWMCVHNTEHVLIGGPVNHEEGSTFLWACETSPKHRAETTLLVSFLPLSLPLPPLLHADTEEELNRIKENRIGVEKKAPERNLPLLSTRVCLITTQQ